MGIKNMKLNKTFLVLVGLSFLASQSILAQSKKQLESQEKIDAAAEKLKKSGKNGTAYIKVNKKGKYVIDGKQQKLKKGAVVQMAQKVKVQTTNEKIKDAQVIKGTPGSRQYVAVEERTGAKSYGKEEKDRTKFGSNKGLQGELANARKNEKEIVKYKGKDYRAGKVVVTAGTPDKVIPAEYKSQSTKTATFSTKTSSGKSSGKLHGRRVASTKFQGDLMDGSKRKSVKTKVRYKNY